LGIEIRSDRADVAQVLQALLHTPTWLAVSAERAVSRVMGGSCSMPLAAYATLQGDQLSIRATWGDPEGRLPLVNAQASATVKDGAAATLLGEQVARELQASVQRQAGNGS
jgi:hydroxymethylbilane synthase